MGYYDKDEYEPTEDEMEQYESEEATKTDVKDNILKIEFDMENMCIGIVNNVKERLRNDLYSEILREVKEDIVKDIKQTILTSAGEIVKELIVDFMKNEKITVGGDYWGNTKAEEYTLMEYAKKCVGDAIGNTKFTVVTEIKEEKDGWSGRRYRITTKDYKFEEFINAQLGIGNEIQKYLTEQIGDIKNQVNKDMKNLFDKATKDMLSESVLNVLMANDTYKKIQNQVACIADRTVN